MDNEQAVVIKALLERIERNSAAIASLLEKLDKVNERTRHLEQDGK